MKNPIPFLPPPEVGFGLLAFLLVLLAGFKIALSRPPSVRPVHLAGRVVGVVGRMGSGKSYFAVRMAQEQLAAGADVASNFTMHLDRLPGLRGQWHYFADWYTLCESAKLGHRFDRSGNVVRRLVVIIDEAQLLADSGQRDLPAEARWVLTNGRKLGMDLYWITQNEVRVAKRLRDLTNEIFVCRSMGSGKRFEAYSYEPEKVRRKGHEMYRLRYRFEQSIADLYDTLEIIETGDHLAMDEGVRRMRDLGRAQNARRGVR